MVSIGASIRYAPQGSECVAATSSASAPSPLAESPSAPAARPLVPPTVEQALLALASMPPRRTYFYCVSSRGHEEEAVSEGSEVETELGDKRGSVATT